MLVYLVTNKITGLVYIGQTTLTLEERKGSHEREAKSQKRPIVKFHKALLKYGFDNFAWESLRECKTKEELDYYESYYISIYNSCSNEKGYNLKYGGNGGGLMNDEGKANLSKSAKIKWQDPERAKRMLNGLRKGTETVKKQVAMNFIEHTCPVCGKTFRTKNWDSHTYCSIQCVGVAQKDDMKARSNKAAAIAREKTENRRQQWLPLIQQWCQEHRTLIENAKFNDLKFLKELATFVGVKDTRSLGALLGVKYKKEICWKLKDIIKYMPTNTETC